MVTWEVTVRKGRKYNAWAVRAATELDARAAIKRAIAPGWRIVAVVNVETRPKYTPIFG